jgi:hypothetical protein
MPHAEDFEGKLPTDHIVSPENTSHTDAGVPWGDKWSTTALLIFEAETPRMKHLPFERHTALDIERTSGLRLRSVPIWLIL